VWGSYVGCGEGCVGRDRVCVEGWGGVRCVAGGEE
jgi:hypothetical protein